jgi:hypothetical protein
MLGRGRLLGDQDPHGPALFRTAARFQLAPFVLQPSYEHQGAKETRNHYGCQRRIFIYPVLPVGQKNPYARNRRGKPHPECSHEVSDPDRVPIFHFGNMRQ